MILTVSLSRRVIQPGEFGTERVGCASNQPTTWFWNEFDLCERLLASFYVVLTL